MAPEFFATKLLQAATMPIAAEVGSARGVGIMNGVIVGGSVGSGIGVLVRVAEGTAVGKIVGVGDDESSVGVGIRVGGSVAVGVS